MQSPFDRILRLLGPTEMLALFLAVHATTALSYRIIGIRNKALLLLFVIVWLAPTAKRLSEARRGTSAMPKVASGTIREVLVILAGAGPWLLLGISYRLHPTWPVWVSGQLPVWLRGVGVVIGVVAVLVQYGSKTTVGVSLSKVLMPRFTTAAQLLTLSLLLMSASLVLGLIVAMWLAALSATRAIHSIEGARIEGLC